MSGQQSISSAAVEASLHRSLARAHALDEPFRHFILDELFPKALAEDLALLPFEAPALDGVSGTREVHNATRRYFDPEVQRRMPSASAVAEAFQADAVCADLAARFGAPIAGTFLRLEYAQDTDGFWLAPHTDLGVKKLTCLIYLSADPAHASLGTDVYGGPDHHLGAVPFTPNAAMCFVPGADTWHGFEKRPIEGVRRSLIVNYVTSEWRAKEQLAFPDRAVHLA